MARPPFLKGDELPTNSPNDIVGLHIAIGERSAALVSVLLRMNGLRVGVCLFAKSYIDSREAIPAACIFAGLKQGS